MNINILIIISCVCMLFVIGKIFIIPIKRILKLVFNSILGGGVIWIINLIGGVWGFHIGLNIYTSVLVRHSWCAWGYNSDYCKDYFKVKMYRVQNFSRFLLNQNKTRANNWCCSSCF